MNGIAAAVCGDNLVEPGDIDQCDSSEVKSQRVFCQFWCNADPLDLHPEGNRSPPSPNQHEAPIDSLKGDGMTTA
jgi:hypothetical protein